MKILIADDDLISRRVIESAMKNGGYDYIMAHDGDEAWGHLQAPQVQIAVLDWIMPGLEGPEICRRLREQNRPTPVYVLLLTARRDKACVVEGLEAGANDYITKPFDESELRARVEVGRKVVELQMTLAARVAELEAALAQVKQLQGMLPICCYCQKVRDDRNYWQRVEEYVAIHTELRFSHGICPGCWIEVVVPQLRAANIAVDDLHP